MFKNPGSDFKILVSLYCFYCHNRCFCHKQQFSSLLTKKDNNIDKKRNFT